MCFKLMKLYRNYRNIDSVVSPFSENEMMVFGHFDRISLLDVKSADNALEKLYEGMDESRDVDKKTDIQPVIMYSPEDHFNINSCINKCVVVSFMQIPTPAKDKNINNMYLFAKKLINDELKRAKYINDGVEAHIYIPLSFMSIAVIFVADSYVDICSLLKNMLAKKIIGYQYSILAVHDTGLPSTKDTLSLSMRFIWNRDKQNEYADNIISHLKEILHNECNMTNNDFKITHLMGNNDCLLTVVNEGYKVLTLLIEYELGKCKQSVKDFFEHVKNTRVSIRINEENISKDDDEEDIKKSREEEINKFTGDAIINLSKPWSTKDLLNTLDKFSENRTGLVRTTIIDLKYKIKEFEKFMNIIYEHAQSKISVQLYNSIVNTFKLFIKVAKNQVGSVLCSKEYNQLQILDAIGGAITDMSSYYGNILHCQLGFFEERGFYNNLIGVASHIELAYNEYANHICKALMCENEKNVQKINMSCYVVSDKSSSVCAVDPFDACEYRPTNQFVISINIPIPYIFKYKAVSYFIIHEAAHFLGCRQRTNRADCAIQALIYAISHVVWQYMDINIQSKNGDSTHIIDDFKQSNEWQILEDEANSKIYEYISSRVEESSQRRLPNKSDELIYNNMLMNILVEVSNELLIEEKFVTNLTEIIADFFGKISIFFESFYAKNYIDYGNCDDLLSRFFDIGTVGYNFIMIKEDIISLFNKMICNNTPEWQPSELATNVFAPDLGFIIEKMCKSINEAYSDLMMIAVTDMNNDEYTAFQGEWNKSMEKIIEEDDCLSWLRINFVAIYMGEKTDAHLDGVSNNMRFFSDSGIIQTIAKYFNGLRDDFSKVRVSVQQDPALCNYIREVKKGKDLEQFKAVYNMFMNI